MKERTRRRFRMLTTLIAMVLTLCLMCFGVYAATQIQYTGGNTLTFEAKNVSAKVSGLLRYNSKDHQTLTFSDPKSTDVDPDVNAGNFDPEDNEGASYSDTVALPDFNFANITDVYTLDITIENTFTEEENVSLQAIFTAQVTDSPTVTVEGEELPFINMDISHTSGTAYTIAPTGSVTFKVTLEIDERFYDQVRAQGFSNVKFDFSLSITRAITQGINV